MHCRVMATAVREMTRSEYGDVQNGASKISFHYVFGWMEESGKMKEERDAKNLVTFAIRFIFIIGRTPHIFRSAYFMNHERRDRQPEEARATRERWGIRRQSEVTICT